MNVHNFKWLAVMTGVLLLLSGCSGGDDAKVEEKPAAVHFESGDECHVCGMVIANFPGPRGEVITEREQKVRKFCSTRDMFAWALQPENANRSHTFYVHDMAQTEWDHPDDTALIDARDAFYVIGSGRQGAMGPTLASFATEVAASGFASENGGRVVRFSDITMDDLTAMMSTDGMPGAGQAMDHAMGHSMDETAEHPMDHAANNDMEPATDHTGDHQMGDQMGDAMNGHSEHPMSQ